MRQDPDARVRVPNRDFLLLEEALEQVEALSELHSYFDCDWVRVTTDAPGAMHCAGQVIPAEPLLEEGLLDVAMALTFFDTPPQRVHDYVRTAKSVRETYNCKEEN